jgi:single-strand DNA-binding protein
MNRVTITGRLTKDPELTNRSGTQVCDLRIAENGNRNGDAMYVDVAVFRRQAEACAQYLAKGRLVAVTGQLRYAEWQAQDGSKRSKHSIVAQSVEFLDTKRNDEQALDPEGSEPVGSES